MGELEAGQTLVTIALAQLYPVIRIGSLLHD